MHQILLINTAFHSDHPILDLMQSYKAGAEMNNNIEVCEMHFRDLQFISDRYESWSVLKEDDSIRLLSRIQWADHIVFFCRIKFGSLPLRLRYLLTSIGLNVGNNQPEVCHLYQDKSIRFFYIMDMPRLFYLIHFGELRPSHRISKTFKLPELKSLKSTELGNSFYKGKGNQSNSLKKLQSLGKRLC